MTVGAIQKETVMRVRTLVPAILLAGCAAEGDQLETSATSQSVEVDNGISLQGISLQGISLQGISLQGISLQGISLQGISLQGISLQGISLQGISLQGISLQGISLQGTDFIGATMEGLLSNGQTLELRIDDIAPLTGDNSDVLAYEISVSSDGTWTSLCGYDGNGTPIRALPVPGVWNLSNAAWSDDGQVFTFACRGATIAKCVEIGYKTWNGLGDHQRSCVRMMRADYCGDGVTYTVTGTAINLYDNAGVQVDTESWPVDAEWTPDGALCFNNYRGGTLPACSHKQSSSCGTWDGGAFLINEYNGGTP
jgi:hypothetical protein